MNRNLLHFRSTYTRPTIPPKPRLVDVTKFQAKVKDCVSSGQPKQVSINGVSSGVTTTNNKKKKNTATALKSPKFDAENSVGRKMKTAAQTAAAASSAKKDNSVVLSKQGDKSSNTAQANGADKSLRNFTAPAQATSPSNEQKFQPKIAAKKLDEIHEEKMASVGRVEAAKNIHNCANKFDAFAADYAGVTDMQQKVAAVNKASINNRDDGFSSAQQASDKTKTAAKVLSNNAIKSSQTIPQQQRQKTPEIRIERSNVSRDDECKQEHEDMIDNTCNSCDALKPAPLKTPTTTTATTLNGVRKWPSVSTTSVKTKPRATNNNNNVNVNKDGVSKLVNDDVMDVDESNDAATVTSRRSVVQKRTSSNTSSCCSDSSNDLARSDDVTGSCGTRVVRKRPNMCTVFDRVRAFETGKTENTKPPIAPREETVNVSVTSRKQNSAPRRWQRGNDRYVVVEGYNGYQDTLKFFAVGQKELISDGFSRSRESSPNINRSES